MILWRKKTCVLFFPFFFKKIWQLIFCHWYTKNDSIKSYRRCWFFSLGGAICWSSVLIFLKFVWDPWSKAGERVCLDVKPLLQNYTEPFYEKNAWWTTYNIYTVHLNNSNHELLGLTAQSEACLLMNLYLCVGLKPGHGFWPGQVNIPRAPSFSAIFSRTAGSNSCFAGQSPCISSSDSMSMIWYTNRIKWSRRSMYYSAAAKLEVQIRRVLLPIATKVSTFCSVSIKTVRLDNDR